MKSVIDIKTKSRIEIDLSGAGNDIEVVVKVDDLILKDSLNVNNDGVIYLFKNGRKVSFNIETKGPEYGYHAFYLDFKEGKNE